MFFLICLQFLHPRLILCSEQQLAFDNCEFLKLTPQSLAYSAARLTSGPADPFIIRLQNSLTRSITQQQFCLKYLIGSVAVFGQADRDALRAISELCRAKRIKHLSDLLAKLAERNNIDTVAQFIAKNIGRDQATSPLEEWIINLSDKEWRSMEALLVKVLHIWEGDLTRLDMYCRILKRLPIEQQYDIIDGSSMPLDIISSIHITNQFNPSLREMFALARCSYHPSPKIRNYIADKLPYFGQFLADFTIESSTSSCRDGVPALDTDSWFHVTMFLDVETLLFVLPLVCTTWRRLHSKAITHNPRIHRMYLEDLCHVVALSDIHTIAPWNYHLPSEASALKYFGWCIVNGALDGVKATYLLRHELKQHLKAVGSGKTPLPSFKDYASPYDSFLRLFEMAYGYCAWRKFRFNKPVFFTDEEYERAIRYFVCRKGWVLRLSESWIVDDIPRMFKVIGEDEELMKELILRQFGRFAEPSIILMMRARTDSVSEKLIRLIFSQDALFRRLIEPEFICPSEYYDFITESDIFSMLLTDYYYIAEFSQLMSSIILSFRHNPGKIDRIVSSTVNQLSGLRGFDSESSGAKLQLERELSALLKDTNRYSPEDVSFIKEVMMRLGLPRVSNQVNIVHDRCSKDGFW